MMKIDELLIIQTLKDCGYIKDENDIAEIRIDDDGISIKLNQSLKTSTIEMEVE